MSGRRLSAGRVVTVVVLLGLLLTISTGVYVVLARIQRQAGPPVLGPGAEEEALRLRQTRELTVLLTILLISVLLTLLFVLGAYLLIRIGRQVARTRTPLGGTPTPYVDAWRQYRLSDAQISAATAEDAPGDDGAADAGRGPPDDDDPARPPGASGNHAD